MTRHIHIHVHRAAARDASVVGKGPNGTKAELKYDTGLRQFFLYIDGKRVGGAPSTAVRAIALAKEHGVILNEADVTRIEKGHAQGLDASSVEQIEKQIAQHERLMKASGEKTDPNMHRKLAFLKEELAKAKVRVDDAYRGAWTESVEENEFNSLKVGSTVSRKGVKAKVMSKSINPAKTTSSGERIPAQGVVKFETVDGTKDTRPCGCKAKDAVPDNYAAIITEAGKAPNLQWKIEQKNGSTSLMGSRAAAVKYLEGLGMKRVSEYGGTIYFR